MVLEWGLILCLGSSLVFFGVWVFSRFFDQSSYHLRIATTGNVQHDLHLLLNDGQLALSNQFGTDSTGRIRPLIVESKMLTRNDILRGDRCGQFTVPGLDLRYYWNTPAKVFIWSIEQSLLIPALLSLVLTFWLHRRLGKRKTPPAPGNPQPALNSSPP
jgi:hypothetical protein